MKNLNDVINEMTKTINETIQTVLELYKDDDFEELWKKECGRLDGQIEMLSILTGKNYKKTQNGLEEI